MLNIFRVNLFSTHKVKRHLFLGRKAMTNLDSVLKSRDITLLTKVHLVKAIVLLVMYGCESWTIKKAECQRSDAFKLWCWRRLLTVPWTARRPNQSILKEIKSEYSLEGLLLKLELQYFGHLTQRADSLENTLMLGKVEGQERSGQQRMKWLDDITKSMDMSLSKLWKKVKNMEVWPAAVHDVAKSWTRLSDWTTTPRLLRNNFHSTCWLKGNKRLQSCLTKGYSGQILWLAHPEISDRERTLFGEAVHPNLQGDCCGQLSQERAVGRGFQLETSNGIVNSNRGMFLWCHKAGTSVLQ